jgi:8-oxo-dGTP pyrophosphatase MutT (NUDIX family)
MNDEPTPPATPAPEPVQTAEPAGHAGILYLAAGRALMLKRCATAGGYPGTWAFSAGGIEAGETPIQAAIRESQEETGHTPESGLTLLSERDGFTLYLCTDPQFAPVLNCEHDGYVWAPAADLPQPLHPGCAEAIEAALQMLQDQQTAASVAAMDESARQLDTNGWAEIKGNPISKVGVFPYSGGQLAGAPDPSRVYQVLRPPEELGAAECIASFRLLPWIDNHRMLGSEELDLMPAEKKGVQGVIGEDVYFEAPYLRGNLKVFSQTLAGLIEAGKRELSAGYRCTYDWTPGIWEGQPYDCVQRNIRGNHLALVMSGRMGPDVAVLDAADPLDQVSLTTDAKEPQMADEASKEEGGSGAMTLEAALEAFKAVMPAFELIQKMAAGKAAEGDKPAVDAEDPEKKDAPAFGDKPADEDKPKPAMDAAEVFKQVMGQVTRRDALAKQLSVHVGTFDHSEMTEAEVAAYGAKKLGLNVPAGQEAAALAGFLKAAVDPRQQRVAMAADAKDGAHSGGDNFVTRHINAKSKE